MKSCAGLQPFSLRITWPEYVPHASRSVATKCQPIDIAHIIVAAGGQSVLLVARRRRLGLRHEFCRTKPLSKRLQRLCMG